MAGNAAHGFAEEVQTGWNSRPRGRARRVGQGNQVERPLSVPNSKGTTDYFIEFFEGKELGNREFAHCDNEMRPEKIDLVVHPGGTVADFVRRRNAISAGRRFPGETATNSGEINPPADLFFIHAAELIEPTEQSPPGCPRERLAEDGLFYPGRLANQHDFAQDRTARDRQLHRYELESDSPPGGGDAGELYLHLCHLA